MHNDLAVASKQRREASRHLAERFQFIRFQQSQRPFLFWGETLKKSSAADAGAFPPSARAAAGPVMIRDDKPSVFADQSVPVWIFLTL